MDWFALIAEIGGKDRDGSLGDDSDLLKSASVDDTGDEFETLDGTLLPLESAGLACILNECALQLNILMAGSTIPATNYSLRVTRNKLLEVIQDTEYELRLSGKFTPLYARAKEEAANKNQAGILEEITQKNEQKIKTLQMHMRRNERRNIRELNKKQETIASLKDEIQEIVSKNDDKLRYIDRWETSRQEQNQMRCDNAELELKHKLEDISDNLTGELRVFQETSAYLNLAHKKLENEIEKWKDKYDEEMGRRNAKIRLIQAKRTEEQIKLRELTALYEEHQREINDYLEYKEEKRREAERDKYIYDMVTKIQAWWRGTMVRRGLGPYKKRRKLGKDKKKKK